MKKPLKIVALQHADGSIGIMQLFADVDVQDEINRSVFHSPVVEFNEVTSAEADAIRANRPQPKIEIPAGFAPVSGNSAEIAELRQLLLVTAETVEQQAKELAKTRSDSQRNLEILMQSLEAGIRDAASKGSAA